MSGNDVTEASSEFNSRQARPWFAAAILLLTFAAFYTFDTYLGAIETSELATEAKSYFNQAQHLVSEQRYQEAIPIYRRAAALDRSNGGYRLALARALVAARRYEEAAPILTDGLRDDPNDGPTNLEMARALRAQQDTIAAAAYFHRAIYGSWTSSADKNSLTARLELVEMLAGQHHYRELLSELLPLEDLAMGNFELQKRVAGLFLIAGSPARAAEAYQRLVRERPQDPSVYAGLGNAELALGNYRAAHSAYSSALRRGGDVRQDLETAAELDQLDPTPRRLSLPDRFERSRQILARAIAGMEQCRASADAEAVGLRKRGTALLDKRHNRPPYDSEELLSVAEDVWQFLHRRCPEAAERDRTLTILMERLQQRP